jgi:hypothetical protein
LLVYDAISHGISFSKGSYVVVQDYQTTTGRLLRDDRVLPVL